METETATPNIIVLDDSRRNARITGYVRVTAPEGVTDDELADAAGLNSGHHFGGRVIRGDDGTATVELWND